MSDFLDEFLSLEGGTILVNVWDEDAEVELAMREVMAELEKQRRRNLKILRLSLQENQDWAARYRVRGTPAVLIFQEGRLVACIRGRIELAILLLRLEELGL